MEGPIGARSNGDPLPPLDGQDEDKREYIKTMIAIAQDDITHVRLYITLALGVVALFLTQEQLRPVRAFHPWLRALDVAGLALLALSALFFFRYIRELHKTRMRMARCLPSLDTARTREVWAGDTGVWNRYGWNYRVGRASLGVGLAVLTVYVADVLLVPPR